MLGSRDIVLTLRRFGWYGALGSVTVLVACADPLRNNFPFTGDAGAGGTGTSAGKGGAAGKDGETGGTAGSVAGKAGKGGASGNKGGKGGAAGGSAGGSSGGNGGSTSNGGSTGGVDLPATGGMAGDMGAAGETGGAAGESAGGMSGSDGAGTAGLGGMNAAGSGGQGGMPAGGGKSTLPEPPTTGITQPDGTPGNFKVLDWAGFTGAISFTFDDAAQSQLTAYSALNAVGVPMTFYLVCTNDGSKAGWKTAYEDGHELGNHTMHHCNANGLNCAWGAGLFTSVDAELDDCNAHLKTAFGVDAVYTMASPYGDQAWATPAGERFIASRGVYDNPNGVAPKDNTSPFDLPCHLADEAEEAIGGFNVITDSAHDNGSWRIILNHSLGNNDGYHPVDPDEVVAAMTYAKELGDMWVDTVTRIASYWRAQKLVAALTPSTSGSDKTWTWTLPSNFPPGQYLRVTVDGGTLTQGAATLEWDQHGYYEVALDFGSVTLSP